jgi:hypothetical protein
MRLHLWVPFTLALAACGDPPAAAEREPVPTDKAAPAAAPAPASSIVAVAAPGSECLHDAPEDGGHHGDCASGDAPADGGDASAKTGAGHFGAPFALAQTQSLASVLEGYASIGETPVQVRGEVDAVCQKKGCWMVIKDGDATARVLMKDHGFAVPFDGKGKKAVVEGTIRAKQLSEAQVKHIEEDAGRDPSAVSGTRNEYILTASGIRLES